MRGLVSLFPLALAACSGGGLSNEEAAASQFLLLDIGVGPGQVWQINRPIDFVFSHPVDFATVNLNTINIAQTNGAPAVGTFVSNPADPTRVTFLPACPTKDDFSDAGFLPGGVSYRIHVAGQDSGGVAVHDTAGKPLLTSQTLTFTTPVSTGLTDLFLDLVNGPPSPVLRQSAGGIGTRVVVGGDEANALYFQFNSQGTGELPGGALLPLNLYSDPTSRVEFVIEINQPVNPSLENVSSSRIQLQFDADVDAQGEDWQPLPAEVELVANCTATGATVRLRPVGVLPQDRPLRLWIGAEFEDLVGDRNILALVDFAHSKTDFFQDGLGFPLEFTDEFREEFSTTTFEDENAVFDTPRGVWADGELEPGFGFTGTGGPGGNFDWHIPPGTDFVLDTTTSVITGGPDGLPTAQQLVVGGLVDIDDFWIPASSSLRIQGPNPAVFLCSGSVTIDGELIVDGNSARSVFTLNTPNQPEAGASGNAGGGDGGTGSFLTTTSTPRGGSGEGAFGVPGAGGEGGESGWSPDNSSSGANRRAGGGGGGTLGHDQILPDGCPEQAIIGLDAESGFPGSPNANAATRPGEQMPYGGHAAQRPFTNSADTPEEREDDFFGAMIKDFGTPDERLVVGELSSPWAGSGGGAGGDATQTSTYPPPSLVLNQEDKGAGGGGGAGSLTILALGPITFGPGSQLSASGGHGAGGENTSGTNRIAGGSGGGSGGHVILQTASSIDFSQVSTSAVTILLKGGQGGAGEGNNGGANQSETLASRDSIHNGLGPPSDNPWDTDGCPGPQNTLRRCAGGDGGPGILQLHVSDPTTDFVYPSGGESTIESICKPAPLGFDIATNQWKDHYLPQFGSISKAQSKWIPLGGVHAAPGSASPDPISFLFGGTDPTTGEVTATSETVDDLPAILTGTIGVDATVDSGDPRLLHLSAAGLAPADEFYTRNPHLLERFLLIGGGVRFDVVAAGYDAAADEFDLTVSSSGPVLPTSGAVELRPRYFAISTSGQPNHLPSQATIAIEFQATTANAQGDPDASNVFPAPGTWTGDVSDLNGAPANDSFRFFRFRVTFDVGGNLSFSTPKPKVDFLRIPFRF